MKLFVKTSSLAALGLLALTACSGPSAGTSEPSSSPSSSSSSSASPSGVSTEAASSSGAYTTAAWALPISEAGDKLGTIKGDSFSVDIYQVATDVASKDSMFVDKETKENLLKKGDPVVYLNYVVTNTSTAEIPLSHSLVNTSAKYTDWKYLGGMPSDSSSEGFKKHGLSDSGIKLKRKRSIRVEAGRVLQYCGEFCLRGRQGNEDHGHHDAPKCCR